MDKTVIDLDNNVIIRSENIEHEDDTLKNYLDSRIIERGTNSDGSYIKFWDGTLICTKKVTGSVSITSNWGSLYDTGEAPLDLGSWPCAFFEVPENIQVTFAGGNGQWVEGFSEAYSKTKAGKVTIASATSKNANAQYNVMAIGRWK